MEETKHYKLGNTIQEFEELFGNVPFEEIEKIKKYLLENYIPKSKIRKILDKQYELFNGKNQKEYSQEVVDVLEELLMEDK